MKSSKPKRSESTLSRFSSIFKSDGKKLTDVMVDEFKLNDRFSGESSFQVVDYHLANDKWHIMILDSRTNKIKLLFNKKPELY